MKSILNMVAVCALVALAGCSSTKTNSASPGAMGEKSECSTSCAEKCTGAKTDASMGAVGEKKSGCCADKAKTTDASMGAVGEGKTGCSTKSSCTKSTDASMGAVSEKSGCTKTCPATGKVSG